MVKDWDDAMNAFAIKVTDIFAKGTLKRNATAKTVKSTSSRATNGIRVGGRKLKTLDCSKGLVFVVYFHTTFHREPQWKMSIEDLDVPGWYWMQSKVNKYGCCVLAFEELYPRENDLPVDPNSQPDFTQSQEVHRLDRLSSDQQVEEQRKSSQRSHTRNAEAPSGKRSSHRRSSRESGGVPW